LAALLLGPDILEALLLQEAFLGLALVGAWQAAL
jgi:hypothetical protein